jgi:hypothetical protein
MPPEAGLFLALERCWLTSVTPSRSRHARPVLVGHVDRSRICTLPLLTKCTLAFRPGGLRAICTMLTPRPDKKASLTSTAQDLGHAFRKGLHRLHTYKVRSGLLLAPVMCLTTSVVAEPFIPPALSALRRGTSQRDEPSTILAAR